VGDEFDTPKYQNSWVAILDTKQAFAKTISMSGAKYFTVED